MTRGWGQSSGVFFQTMPGGTRSANDETSCGHDARSGHDLHAGGSVVTTGDAVLGRAHSFHAPCANSARGAVVASTEAKQTLFRRRIVVDLKAARVVELMALVRASATILSVEIHLLLRAGPA